MVSIAHKIQFFINLGLNAMKKLFLLILFLPALCSANQSRENDPRYQYYSCVKRESLKYSKSSEPAETAAIAAIQSCRSFETKAVYAAGPELSPVQQQKIRALFQEQTKPFAIKIIMDARLDHENSPSASN